MQACFIKLILKCLFPSNIQDLIFIAFWIDWKFSAIKITVLFKLVFYV